MVVAIRRALDIPRHHSRHRHVQRQPPRRSLARPPSLRKSRPFRQHVLKLYVQTTSTRVDNGMEVVTLPAAGIPRHRSRRRHAQRQPPRRSLARPQSLRETRALRQHVPKVSARTTSTRVDKRMAAASLPAAGTPRRPSRHRHAQ
nr:hypothetical protein CFP56_21595 [Quercus suber]